MIEFNPRSARAIGIALLFMAIIMLANPFMLREGFPLFITGPVIIIAALLVILAGLVFLVMPPEDIMRLLRGFLLGIPLVLMQTIFAALFLAVFALLIVFLLFPYVIPLPYAVDPQAVNQTLRRDVQIIGCICSAGMLGGFVNRIFSRPTTGQKIAPSGESSQNAEMRFWTVLNSLFCSLFVSLVIFLLIRAGILKAVEVDTFNIYGVTGMSAITGYFAENIMRRLRTVYETILGSPENK